MCSTDRRQRAPERAAQRREVGREPGERKAIRAAAIGGRLGRDGGDRRRDHDHPQRPLQQPEGEAPDPRRRKGAGRRDRATDPAAGTGPSEPEPTAKTTRSAAVA
jgi:hypothetical protein